jgi:hypothetical protein
LDDLVLAVVFAARAARGIDFGKKDVTFRSAKCRSHEEMLLKFADDAVRV